MRKVLTIAALFALLTPTVAFAASSQGAASVTPANPSSATIASTVVLVPGGTAVPVHVVGEVSSSKVKIGDTFGVQAVDNVVVNGFIVIRKGALGQGTIGEVAQAGGSGRSGSLAMTFDWIYAADGGKIHLARSSQKQAEEDRKGASSTATIIGFATFGIGGLFGHNFAHGRNVTIDERKVLGAFVADNVHVDATERARDTDHFDH
ncbi:MAG: hypothetical protein NVS2B8_12150 [Vulcanimicrobiaceae bacterium]